MGGDALHVIRSSNVTYHIPQKIVCYIQTPIVNEIGKTKIIQGIER